jgi:hypothetical protein
MFGIAVVAVCAAAFLGLCKPALAAPGPNTPLDLADIVPDGGAAMSAPGLRPEVLGLALEAERCAGEQGLLRRPGLLTVIDYSLPSTRRRLWVLDLERGEVLFNELVAHGQGTGGNLARAFSNVSGSHQSSVGSMVTAETYYGKHGLSLRLDGVEPGFNDLARERTIVIHGADYVSEDFIHRVGRLGRSWGCPALPEDVSGDVIETIAGGSLVFGYYPDADWLASSPLLHCEGDLPDTVPAGAP